MCVLYFLKMGRVVGLTLTFLSLPATQLDALNIELDYTYDVASDNFFGGNATAKAALEQAATDLSTFITTEFGSVSGAYSGTNASTTATFRWDSIFKDPSTNVDVTLTTPSLAANTVKIFIGVDELSGSTLGKGGSNGVQTRLGGSGFGSEWTAALATAAENYNNGISRGAGPVINSSTGAATLGGVTAPYAFNVGLGMGKFSLDVDTDNNGTKDSASELNDYWHFDHTTAVPNDKFDLYTVALHEILHVLGVGVSDTWDDQYDGFVSWTGSEAIAANGTGSNLIDIGGGHISGSTSSIRLSDNQIQEAVMTPSINAGERRELTELDAAFLIDLGYTTVPEPSSALLLGSASVLLLLRKRAK